MDEENLILEDAQSNAYVPLKGQYNFKVDVAGITSQKSPDLDVMQKGVRLHFFRYGLFDDNTTSQTVTAPLEDGESEQLNEVFINADFPTLQHFIKKTTAISTGYIYMFNEADPDLWFEYQVDQFGMIRGVELKNNKKPSGGYKDIREVTTKNTAKNYIIPNKLGKHYIVFTPIQWPIAYIKELLKEDRKKLKKRARLIDLNPLSKSEVENQHEVYCYKQIQASFTKNQIAEQHRFDGYLKNIHAFETADDSNSENTHYEDLFVSFDDPIAAAYDISASVEREIDRLKALTLSSSTGISDETLYQDIKNDTKIAIKHTEKARQIKYMHTLAATTYKYIYDNPELTKKHSKHKKKYKTEYNSSPVRMGEGTSSVTITTAYEDADGEYDWSKGVSKEKIFKILAINERKAQRALINEYREDLGNFLLSDYYQDIFDDFEITDAIGLGIGKEAFAEHLIALGQYPNFYDHHLDLSSEYKPEEDKWLKKISNTLTTTPTEFKKAISLMDVKGDLKEDHYKPHHSFIKKAISISSKIGKAFYLQGLHEKAYEVLKGRINCFVNHNTGVGYLKYRDSDLTEYMAKNKREITSFKLKDANGKPKLDANGKPIVDFKNYGKSIHKDMGKMSRREMLNYIDDLDEGALIINHEGIPNEQQNRLKQILKSPEFGSLVLLFEVISLGYAIKKYNDNPSRLNYYLRAGSGIKVVAAGLQLADNMGVATKLPRFGARYFGYTLQGFKLAGSIITVLVSTKDAIRDGGTHDYDSAMASAAAAGVGAIFVGYDIALLAGGAALGLWPAAVLGGVLIGLYGIAIYLKDDAIEAYFKNFPLSNVDINPNSTEKPHEYIQRLYAAQNKTVTTSSFLFVANTDYLENTDFEVAYTNLFDLITPGELLLKPDPYYQKRSISKQEKGIFNDLGSRRTYGNRFLGSFEVFQFFQHFEDLDLQVWFYPNGIGRPNLNNEQERIKINFIISKIINEKNKPSRCEFEFGIPRSYDSIITEKEYLEGEVLVLCRLITGENEYIPLNLKGKDRYYVINARPYNTSSSMMGLGGAIPVTGSVTNYKPLKLKGNKDEAIKIIDLDNVKNLRRFDKNIINE